MENNTMQKISTPAAIVVAGFLIMVGILLTNGKNNMPVAAKTLSEQVGVSKDTLASCVKDTNTDTLNKSISASVESAMKAVPDTERGTPYSVIVGKNGAKAEIRGNDSYDNTKKIIAEVLSGKVTAPYKGEAPAPTKDDHIIGDINAPIIIIEYSDFECPYCKMFNVTIKKIVDESNGQVAWIYRHWPIHQNSFAKLVAAECVAKIKGNDAFWKYTDLLFTLVKTSQDTSATDQL